MKKTCILQCTPDRTNGNMGRVIYTSRGLMPNTTTLSNECKQILANLLMVIFVFFLNRAVHHELRIQPKSKTIDLRDENHRTSPPPPAPHPIPITASLPLSLLVGGLVLAVILNHIKSSNSGITFDTKMKEMCFKNVVTIKIMGKKTCT